MLVATAAATAAAISPLIVNAQGNDPSTAGAVPAERIYVESVYQPRDAMHGGFTGHYIGEPDSVQVGNALSAIASDRSMNGAVLTVVSQDGDLVANGTTTDLAQATRLETKLKKMGAKRVFSWFDSPGGN
jgi:hypothetical protein